ncbi:hemicentin-1-like [Choristoneura fumiferana]|uniref:hemicentin-1-like n=1 Tax=Choristoneura fumiferana TaxID=7141 RepID=UPI003D15E8DE
MLQYGILFGVIFMQPVLSMETEVVVLRAVRGQDARLPCGQGKVFLDGPDAYVLWLKNDREFLYRFPNEETERRSLTLDQVFGTTCVAGACHDDTSLLLKRVSDRDGGIYRCRVHYQASPSVDYVIEIRLVDSPGLPRIYNDAGELLKRGHIQHLSLGANLTLTCVVDDEQPDTLVFWRRNGAVAERAHAASGSLRATVRVRNATRAELDAHYECLAQNADVTEPLSASVLVTMYLPPLSVEIRLNNNVDFEAGQPRVVDCVVVGCVPPPSITWHLGDTLLRPSVHKELHDGNYTVSSLTLAPSLRDSGRELACRAHNSHLPASVFQDKVTLNVGYRPICLSPGEEVVGAVQREAETVSCVVEASPEPLQFSWTFADSRTLYTSVKKLPGHQHRYSSTLTWLPRAGDSGPLLCRATNAFGEQKRPCAYAVAAGGAPAAPDCVLLRSYPDALRVQCKKGWDGGRPQTIHLTLRDADGTVLRNVSDAAGHFHLQGVGERNLSALVYASSIRGRSREVTLHLQATKPLSAPVIELTPARSWTRWLEVAAGGVAVAAAVAATALCVRALRARRENVELNPDLVPRSDGTFHREPDFVGGERVLGTTNITVNQLAACQNQYSSSPVPSCRVMVGCPRPAQDACPATQHSYFV